MSDEEPTPRLFLVLPECIDHGGRDNAALPHFGLHYMCEAYTFGQSTPITYIPQIIQDMSLNGHANSFVGWELMPRKF
ncbi:hypothetical protein BGZ92_000831 [Podila epicladia]|nr:hypothetical protein BGZ92_000831 [Podila epicladia]